jgi:hypothetical protein
MSFAVCLARWGTPLDLQIANIGSKLSQWNVIEIIRYSTIQVKIIKEEKL